MKIRRKFRPSSTIFLVLFVLYIFISLVSFFASINQVNGDLSKIAFTEWLLIPILLITFFLLYYLLVSSSFSISASEDGVTFIQYSFLKRKVTKYELIDVLKISSPTLKKIRSLDTARSDSVIVKIRKIGDSTFKFNTFKTFKNNDITEINNYIRKLKKNK